MKERAAGEEERERRVAGKRIKKKEPVVQRNMYKRLIDYGRDEMGQEKS